MMPVQPLAEISINPLIGSLPKADLHVHQEEVARLDRIIAGQQGRSSYDWRSWAERMLVEIPAGMSRLSGMYAPDKELALDDMANTDELTIAKIADVLMGEAKDGAILVELRFGVASLAFSQPNFMTLFREAEQRVRSRYPQLHAEPVAFLPVPSDPQQLASSEHQLEKCLRMAHEGLAGIDFLVQPYVSEADPAVWATVYRWAARAVDAGLGITVHAGEFSVANLAAALQVPGLRRLGHAVYAVTDQQLLERLALTGITIECCLSSNVILGAVPSYEVHPIRQFMAADIPVTLNSDDPVRIWTTIGREYAIAAALGFSLNDLITFTYNAVEASFITNAHRNALLNEVQQWEPSA